MIIFYTGVALLFLVIMFIEAPPLIRKFLKNRRYNSFHEACIWEYPEPGQNWILNFDENNRFIVQEILKNGENTLILVSHIKAKPIMVFGDDIEYEFTRKEKILDYTGWADNLINNNMFLEEMLEK